MFRVSVYKNIAYAVEIESIEKDIENIMALIESGEAVLLASDIETITNALSMDVELVEDEDNE